MLDVLSIDKIIVVVNWLVASFHGGKMTPIIKRSLKNKPQALKNESENKGHLNLVLIQ